MNCTSQVCSHYLFFNSVVILRYINYPTFCVGISIHTCMQRKYILFTGTLDLALLISSTPDFNLAQVLVQDLPMQSLLKVNTPLLLEDVMFSLFKLKQKRLNSF